MKKTEFTLSFLISNLKTIQIFGSLEKIVSGLSFDSRKVKAGDIFFALKGNSSDGHFFIPKAIEKGCEIIILEQLPSAINENVTYILVSDSRDALGELAAKFYGNPSQKITLVGVTGTNGKTTLVSLLHGLFQNLGYKTGLLSTVENKIGAQSYPSELTTPDVITIHRMLSEMVESGCSYAFMEVSSHALDQNRVHGVQFSGTVFTNITHDHLDYHGNFLNYLYAKKKLFDQLNGNAFALINGDDKHAKILVQNCKVKTYTYSLQSMADFKAKILSNSLEGLHLEIGGKNFTSKLIGDFNALNLVAVYATGLLLGQNEIEILTQLSKLTPPEGRFNHWINPSRNITGIIDYAHTPDALEKVIHSIQNLKSKKSKLITVIGCGGDRDSAKRPLMGKTATVNSDWAIFTSDNPRSEDPNSIIEEMGGMLDAILEKRVIRLADRRAAIQLAVKLASQGDIVLVAGKGHEKYQEIKGKKLPFDDKIELENALWAL